jgi:hypothetical protein
VGIDNTISSSIQLYLEEQEVVGMRFLKKVPGKVYPESELPENARILPGFIWRGDERLLKKSDIFKGKPMPILPKIKGISLPEDEGDFFDEPEDDKVFEVPDYSKLKPEDLQNREEDPKFRTKESDSLELKKKKIPIKKKEN